jgi:spore maturation protein CgeB
MKLLYIGQCDWGSTSRMRYEKVQLYFNTAVDLINLTPIIEKTPKILRSLGWRLKIGPLIKNINNAIITEVRNNNYDIIWVDKGVFILPFCAGILRNKTKFFIHSTPDPAFLYHGSRLFEKSLKFYDICVTTKSFETEIYRAKGVKNCYYLTQGFDKTIHFPRVEFETKKYDICFIGHREKNREELIQLLLDNDIEVVLAGIKWENFVKKNKQKKLKYFGNHVSGHDYARLISDSKLGLGLLSKWIPEKHTTRTFEIPACGTCLVTEKNDEIDSFFSDIECIKFINHKDCVQKINSILKQLDLLKAITNLGFERVVQDRRDYESQIFDLCNSIVSLK